jgi:hypothetical protein
MWKPTHFLFALAEWMEEELGRERTMQDFHMNLRCHIINLCFPPFRRFSKEMAASHLTWYEISAVRGKSLIGRPALYSGR